MANALVETSVAQIPSEDEYWGVEPEPTADPSLPLRRIEFHKARKPFNGLNKSGGEFKLETLNPGSSSGSSDSRKMVSSNPGQLGLGAKKMDGSEYLEYGLDPELSSFAITYRRIGAGLMNMGNTCYLNSVLQCLTYTEPLAAYLQSGRHRSSCHIAGFCALCAIQKHVSLALQSTGRSLVPKDLVINLRCISRNFTKSRQEDAHEYMVNLLESMHKCCLPSGVPSESPSAYEKSLVHKIFGGRLRSQVKCLQCSHCSNKFDPFLDLSLEIFRADSLQKALGNFTAAEQLDGGERQYQCQRCNQKVRALKQMTIHKPPYVLTIHLKRFRAHDPGRKIDRHVKFGPTLDLRPFVSDSYEGELKYTLYGVLVHCGASTYSGHYYCYVRTSSGIWYSLDDNRVFQVSERVVLEQKAYMLFYVRDRRNIMPRKPAEVAQKQNFNATRFNTRLTNNYGSKEVVQQVSIEGRSSGLSSSIVVTQKDVSTVVPPMLPLLKELSDNCQMSTGNMVPMESVPKSCAKVSSPVDPLKGLLSPNPTSEKGMLLSSLLESSNGGASDPQNATAATTGANNNDINDRGKSIGNSVSTVISTHVKDTESLQAAKPIQAETAQNDKIVSSAGGLIMGSSGVSNGTKMEGIQTVKSADQPSSKINQVGSSTNSSPAGKFSGDKTSDCGQKVVDASVIFSSSSMETNGSLHMKAPDCKRQRKLKKNQMKSKVASMYLRPSLLSRAVLSIQKKKKHKRSKHPIPYTKTLGKELLMDTSSFLSDLGPSTSEKTQSVSLRSTHTKQKSKRKRTKFGLKKDADGSDQKLAVKSHDDYSTAVKIGDFRESQTGTVLASNKGLQNGFVSSSMEVHWETGTDSPQDCKRQQVQNGWMGVPDRGLNETVVARWDGIELPPQIVVPSRAESVRIGYVGDDWDEEYDRGKQKKIRQPKEIFEGPNPFQRVSNQRSQKKAKLTRFDSGNQPFRI